MFILPLLTATGMFIVLWKIGAFKLFKIKETRKVADGGLDAVMTFGLVAIFAGTFSGMIMAMTSGLLFSYYCETLQTADSPEDILDQIEQDTGCSMNELSPEELDLRIAAITNRVTGWY